MRQTTEISESGARWIQDFIHALTIREDLNPKTLKEYASDLRHFVGWYETAVQPAKKRDFHIEDVATSTLMQYRETAKKQMKLKPSTINRRLITLKRFFTWAASECKISHDPAKSVKLIPEEKSSPRKLTDKEEADLIAAVERNGSHRDQTILLVMLHTGLRTMEVCDLTPGDIQLGKRSQLIVRAKRRNKQRTIPLNDTCRTSLEKYMTIRPTESSYLFPSEKTGNRLTERALRHLFQKYIKTAQLVGLSAHDLRHRFGYVMAETTPIHRLAEIMGHDHLDTTMIYVKAARTGS